MWPAMISASAVILAACVTIFLTKRKELEVAWRTKKLAYYEEFLQAVSGTVDSHDYDSQARFADAVNAFQLIASSEAIRALELFLDEVRVSNENRSKVRHDKLYSRLVWNIRKDLNAAPTQTIDEFRAFLWSPGPKPEHTTL